MEEKLSTNDVYWMKMDVGAQYIYVLHQKCFFFINGVNNNNLQVSFNLKGELKIDTSTVKNLEFGGWNIQ